MAGCIGACCYGLKQLTILLVIYFVNALACPLVIVCTKCMELLTYQPNLHWHRIQIYLCTTLANIRSSRIYLDSIDLAINPTNIDFLVDLTEAGHNLHLMLTMIIVFRTTNCIRLTFDRCIVLIDNIEKIISEHRIHIHTYSIIIDLLYASKYIFIVLCYFYSTYY